MSAALAVIASECRGRGERHRAQSGPVVRVVRGAGESGGVGCRRPSLPKTTAQRRACRYARFTDISPRDADGSESPRISLCKPHSRQLCPPRDHYLCLATLSPAASLLSLPTPIAAPSSRHCGEGRNPVEPRGWTAASAAVTRWEPTPSFQAVGQPIFVGMAKWPSLLSGLDLADEPCILLCRAIVLGTPPAAGSQRAIMGAPGSRLAVGSAVRPILGSEVHQWSRKHRAWGRRR